MKDSEMTSDEGIDEKLLVRNFFQTYASAVIPMQCWVTECINYELLGHQKNMSKLYWGIRHPPGIFAFLEQIGSKVNCTGE